MQCNAIQYQTIPLAPHHITEIQHNTIIQDTACRNMCITHKHTNLITTLHIYKLFVTRHVLYVETSKQTNKQTQHIYCKQWKLTIGVPIFWKRAPSTIGTHSTSTETGWTSATNLEIWEQKKTVKPNKGFGFYENLNVFTRIQMHCNLTLVFFFFRCFIPFLVDVSFFCDIISQWWNYCFVL